MTIDCLLHAHSSFSYDSPTDLGDLAKAAKARGYSCILMSEHNNTLDDRQVAALVARCREVSDDTFLVIPGLELSFNKNRVHLLAYGVERFIGSMSDDCTFASLVRAIREQDGLAVLAHPSHRGAIDLLSQEDLASLDGIEIWNTRSGNRYCPDARELRSLRRLRQVQPDLKGYGGVDFHFLTIFPHLVTRLAVDSLTRASVFEALRRGLFTVHSAYASVSSAGEDGPAKLWAYDVLNQTLVRGRRTAYRCQGWLERHGGRTPRLLVEAGRRLF
jgi:hypothetical protein